jgi:hypothetical protein
VLWVLLFIGIALAGLAMVVGYAVWLAHKTSDVLSEVAVLGELGGQLGELVSQVSAPRSPRGPDRSRDLPEVDDRGI